ncbi:MAG: StrR protein [Frankiales bacterium]|nr:StrR protein [Frankiales bacterium]
MTVHEAVPKMVAIDSLDVRGRLRPADPDHVRILADVLDRTPPVLVLSKSRRVLDGFMRLDAARNLGRTVALVEWVTGDEAVAWEQAIRANSSHGLPLSAAQRREAAMRLLALAPHWSDRRIAAAVGVAPRSVGRWRKDVTERAGEQMPHLSTEERVGRDGRRYLTPEELEARRNVVRALLRDHAELSDREVGRRAGLSAAAVHRLRNEPPPVSKPRRRPIMARGVTGLLRSVRGVVRGLAGLLGRLLRQS